MTKQDKIKTGLGNVKLSAISYDGKVNRPHFLSPIDVKNILSHLHSQGVVIKVERELPKPNLNTVSLYCFREGGNWIRPDVRAKMAIEDYGQDICNAGYEAVEPLIKEVMSDAQLSP